MKFDLRRCVNHPERLWLGGIAARRQRELEAFAPNQTHQLIARRSPAKLRHWLARVHNIGSFDAFLGMLVHHRLEPLPLYKAYVTHTLRTGGPEFSAVVEELIVLNCMARHRELRPACWQRSQRSSNRLYAVEFVRDWWAGPRREEWSSACAASQDADFFKGLLCLKI